MSNKIRILIADNHAIVHEELQAVLAKQPKFEVVGAASDGFEAGALVNVN